MTHPSGPLLYRDDSPCRYGSDCGVHPSEPPLLPRFLTNRDVASILGMIADGFPQRDIARAYNVTQTTISAVKLGKIRGSTGETRSRRKAT